jgi:hypothetical protein
MSATLGVLLKEVEPALTLAMFETLHDCAQESSNGWNNAGTGHAGSPHAEPLDRIVSCTARATMNLAFGGPDNARLFIVESDTGSILQADLSTPGLPMFSHSSAEAPSEPVGQVTG